MMKINKSKLNQLEDIWMVLETRPLLPNKILNCKPTDQSADILFALDSEKKKHLLFKFDAPRKVKEDKKSAGIQIVSRSLVDKGSKTNFVDIVCLKPHLIKLFDVLALEIISAYLKEQTSPDIISSTILDQWRELIKSEHKDLLSDQQIIGLFGELICLKKLLKENPVSLNTWNGPLSEKWDFYNDHIAIEVKTTTGRKGRFMEIHSIDQLDCPLDKKLYLLFLKIEKDKGGLFLNDLVKELITICDDQDLLISRLYKYGYFFNNSDDYKDIAFVIKEERLYEVKNNFPKIIKHSFVSGDLPSGVIDLKYTIDLSLEPPFPLTKNNMVKVFKEFVESFI